MPRDTFRKGPVGPPTGPKPQEEPSLLRKLLAGGARVGAGILSSPGGVFGAAVSGVGETVAQGIENIGTGRSLEPDIRRVGIEAGIGAIPFGKVIKGGRWLRDALASGALSGAGEAAREAYSGDNTGILPDLEKIDPKSTALATLLGFGTGGLASKLTGAGKPTAPRVDDIVETTAQPGGQVFTTGGKLSSTPPPRVIPGSAAQPIPPAESPRVSRELPYRMTGEVDPRQANLPFGAVAPPEARFPTPYGAVEPAPYRTSAKAAQRADDLLLEAERKAAENQTRLDEIDRMVAEGELTPQPPTITEVLQAETPLGAKTRATTKYAPPEQDPVDELGELLSTGRVERGGRRWKGVKQEDIPEGGTAREIFEAWLAQGKSPRQSLKLAAKGRPPVGAGIDTPGTRTISDVVQQPAAPARQVLKPELAPGISPITGLPQPDPAKLADDIALSQFAERPETIRATEEAWEQARAKSPSQIMQEAAEEEAFDYAKRVGAGTTEGAAPVAPAVFSGVDDTPSAKLAKIAESEDSLAVLEDILARTGGSGVATVAGKGTFVEPQAATEAAGEVVESSPSALARFFRSPLEAAGEGYGDVKKAIAAGEAVPPMGRQVAARAAQRLRKESGLPAPPRQQATPPGVEGDPMAQVRDLAHLTGELKDLGVQGGTEMAESVGLIDRLRQLNRGQKGAASAELMTQLGLGAAGALTVAAVDPLDNPLLSGAAGFGAGFVAPQAIPALLRGIGAPAEAVQNALSSSEGVKDAANKIFQSLPQIQRFNFLADITGLPANAIVGPWGSAVMASLEHGLSGDPRGWAALRELTHIPTFIKDMSRNMEEAKQLIAMGDMGRAEQGILEGAPVAVRQVIEGPGTYMTAGDVTARKILNRAGFTEEEARRITLTSEPESAAFHSIAEFGKRSPLLQLMFPFRRTPANIGEQGLQRMPGIGTLMQANREIPDSARQQLVQQFLMTPAVAGASFLAGSNMDPETAKTARRYITNLGGQYSLASGIGFGAGQAVNRGQDPLSAAAVGAVRDSLPIPATENLEAIAKFLATGEGSVPRGMIPAFLRNPPLNLGVEEAAPSLTVRTSFRRP